MKWCSFFFALALAGQATAEVGPDATGSLISDLQAGIICAPKDMIEAPAPDTVSGTTHILNEDPVFVSHQRRVPAVLGIAFGIKAQSANPTGLGDVTMTIHHPAMGNRAATSQRFQTTISGERPSLTFYQFDFDYELLLGIWQLEARTGDILLYRTTFEVVPPVSVPELAGICGYAELLSFHGFQPVAPSKT